METLYLTGMRRLKVASLKHYDLGTERSRQAKGKRDRVILIGERAAACVETYIRSVRQQLGMEPDDRTVILSNTGEAATRRVSLRSRWG